jgi:glycosyltransferase involved in cell wall biosynthesis
MDLVADMLWLQAQAASEVDTERIQPRMARRFQHLPRLGRGRGAWNADRLLARFWDYPRLLRKQRDDFDCFHICDHSYAHLVHELPGDRTGVFCHDLDTFRCLLEPEAEPRPVWFRAMARRILSGLQRAVVVFCSTQVTIDRIIKLGLVDSSRLIHVPYGIAPEFTPAPDSSDHQISAIKSSFLLHVGSCIPRKRIDVLLDVFAAVRQEGPQLQLVQVGGQWTAAQQAQIARHGLRPAIQQLRGVNRKTLAQLYRRAALVLLPSEGEGFGLPMVEALACGAAVVASDIPVLREVGGEAAVYCPVSNNGAWVDTVNTLLTSPDLAPDRDVRIARARRFSWENHAATILEAYQRLTRGIASAPRVA